MFATCLITACCKKADFDDDHVEHDENEPKIYFDPDDDECKGGLED
jgi:hypothetical protein